MNTKLSKEREWSRKTAMTSLTATPVPRVEEYKIIRIDKAVKGLIGSAKT